MMLSLTTTYTPRDTARLAADRLLRLPAVPAPSPAKVAAGKRRLMALAARERERRLAPAG
jgi:hypothetical protein